MGQDIQPVFEGWSRKPDGSFLMHFGYFNRNYVEQPSIPVGPNNSIEPGGPDRGQPTVFRPRTNRNLFSVPVMARCCTDCIAMAVELMASAKPVTSAACQGRPKK